MCCGFVNLVVVYVFYSILFSLSVFVSRVFYLLYLLAFNGMVNKAIRNGIEYESHSRQPPLLQP